MLKKLLKLQKTAGFSSAKHVLTRFVTLRGQIPLHCVPSDSVVKVLLSVSVDCVVLGLVIMNSKSAHLFWLPEISGTEDIRYIKIQ